MTDRPYTDLHEIVQKTVAAHMKPFMDVMLHEHEETRKEVKELKDMVCRQNLSVHDVVHYVLILVLGIAMTIGMTSC